MQKKSIYSHFSYVFVHEYPKTWVQSQTSLRYYSATDEAPSYNSNLMIQSRFKTKKNLKTLT